MADVPPEDRHPLERLQSLLLNVESFDAMLGQLAGLATQIVGSTACGITVRYDGSLLTVGSSDSRAETLDESQYQIGQGPCLEALETSSTVDASDFGVEQRWPRYLAIARAAGLRCSLSFPLAFDEATFGALNVYGFERANMFGPSERRELELFAARAAGTLQVARRMSRNTMQLQQMEEALHSRTVIDQAIGIIMGSQRCTSSTAFELLRRESQNSRRRLRELAANLVERIGGQPPQSGPEFDPA